MAEKKIIFIAFSIEDERMRDLLKGQSLLNHCPFEYIDMSVKESYDNDWKEKVRTRIKRSNGIIVLASKNSTTSSGQKWEIECAKSEGKSILAIRTYKDDFTGIAGLTVQPWDWMIIGNFIDRV
ncbi:MAG: TIR domain-containing protein [Saprospiraceae bacterium]